MPAAAEARGDDEPDATIKRTNAVVRAPDHLLPALDRLATARKFALGFLS